MKFATVRIVLVVWLVFYVHAEVFSQKSFHRIAEGGKYGLANAIGTQIIPPIYENIGWSDGTLLPIAEVVGFKKDEFWGLITLKNKIILDPAFTTIHPGINSNIIAQKGITNPLTGLLSPQGKVLISFQYQKLVASGDFYIASKILNGKEHYGLIDQKEKPLIALRFLSVKPISEHIFLVEHSPNRYNLYNNYGTMLSELSLQTAEVVQHNPVKIIIKSEGQYGMIDEQGNILIEPKYKIIEKDQDGYWKAHHFSSWTIMDFSKKPQGQILADRLIPLNAQHTLIERNETYKICKVSGEDVSTDFDNAVIVQNESVSYSINGKYGIMGSSGNELLACDFDTIVSNGVHYFAKKKEQWWVYTHSGFQVGKQSYDTILTKVAAYYAVNKNGYWGYIDIKGNLVIPTLYEQAQCYKYEGAVVKFLGLWGVLDNTGQWIIHPKYDHIRQINNELYLAKEKQRTFLINKNDKILYSTYNSLYYANDVIIEENAFGNKKVIRMSGEPLTVSEYDSIAHLPQIELYTHIRNQKYSLIREDGKVIIPDYSNYQTLYQTNEDFIGIKKDNKYGFIDKLGNLRIANQYSAIGTWKEDKGAVQLNGKWGFVDRLERLTIQPYYDKVTNFHNGVTIVTIGNKYGLLQTDGTESITVEYDSIFKTNFDYYILIKNNQVGMANKEGRMVIQAKYDAISEIDSYTIQVMQNNKYGIKNIKGIDLLPCIYPNVFADRANDLLWHDTPPPPPTMYNP